MEGDVGQQDQRPLVQAFCFPRLTPTAGANLGHPTAFWFPSLFLIDHAIFHDEGDVGDGGDVGEGVGGDGDDVGEEAGLELADLVFPAEEARAVEEAGAESVGGGHAVLHHKFEFAGLGAVGEWADVRSEGHGDSGGELFAELGSMEGEQVALALGGGWSLGVGGEVLGNGEGGDGVDLFVMHEAHGFRAELVGVVDGSDSGLGGVESAGLSGGVDSDAGAATGGLGDGGFEFGAGVLVGSGEGAVDEAVGSGLVDLDEVSAFLELLADDGDEFGGVVGVGGVGGDAGGGIEVDGVFVSREDVNGVAADAEARAGDESGVDGVADGGVGGTCALGSHVALGGESGEEIVAGGDGGEDGALGNGFDDGLEVFGSWMEEEMDVSVDESGHESGIAEVDESGSGGMGDAGTGFDNACATDEDLARSDERGVLDVEKMGGMEDDGHGRGLGVEGGSGERHREGKRG